MNEESHTSSLLSLGYYLHADALAGHGIRYLIAFVAVSCIIFVTCWCILRVTKEEKIALDVTKERIKRSMEIEMCNYERMIGVDPAKAQESLDRYQLLREHLERLW